MPSSEHDALASVRLDPALQQRGLEVRDVLGVGGNSFVYRARDERHDRDVAIKVLRAHARMEHAEQRFERELRVAASVRHLHILPLFDSGTLSDGRRFAVMPVAQGRPLRAMIDEGALAVADALRLTREVGEALAFLHANGWVHRDVKPDNILVEGGHAVLTDFGLAAPLRTLAPPRTAAELIEFYGVSKRDPRLTDDGHVVGTPAYMSPEALWGDAPIDARTDVFSLGIVLFEMLAGQLPFEGNDFASVASAQAGRAIPALSTLRADVPPALDEVLARATAHDAERRFPSMEAFLAALAVIHPVSAPVVPVTRLPMERRGVALVVVLALSLVAAVLGMRARRAHVLDPQHVVVADFANETRIPSLDQVGVLAGDLVTAAVARAPSYTVLNADKALHARRGVAEVDSVLLLQARPLVHASRAGVLVTGELLASRGRASVGAEVTDTRSGRLLGRVGPIALDPRAPQGGLGAMADSVVAVLRRRHAPPATA